jgi:uncharacterized protein
MSSEVFFSKDIAACGKLFDALKIKFLDEGSLAAIKIHFGEIGNTAYLKPSTVMPIIEKVKKTKALAFLTDANTLYKGTRGDAVNHLKTVATHGYNQEKTGLPVIIADGLSGKESISVKIDQKHFKEVKLGASAVHADSMIVITHFKGHELTGFGGALKNVGMGLGSRAGKQMMHADVTPVVNKEKCTSCGKCIKWCPTSAIKFAADNKAEIDPKKCIGCGECIASCNFGAIAISWAGSSGAVQEKIVEYFYGIAKDKKEKMAYFNFVIDVSPNCDCYGWNDKPVVPDIGVFASYDPVAIDAACIDMVNKAAKHDVFRKIYPDADWNIQLDYAAKLRLGTRSYKINEL